MPETRSDDSAEPRRRIDPPVLGTHAEGIAENLRRIAAALPPLPLKIAAPPALEPPSQMSSLTPHHETSGA